MTTSALSWRARSSCSSRSMTATRASVRTRSLAIIVPHSPRSLRSQGVSATGTSPVLVGGFVRSARPARRSQNRAHQEYFMGFSGSCRKGPSAWGMWASSGVVSGARVMSVSFRSGVSSGRRVRR